MDQLSRDERFRATRRMMGCPEAPSGDEANIYHYPEKWGLKQVAMIDYSDGSYQFSYRIVWECLYTGRLFTKHDSGCSCPTPFEMVQSFSDLEDYSYEYVRREALERAREANYGGDDVNDFLRKLPR